MKGGTKISRFGGEPILAYHTSIKLPRAMKTFMMNKFTVTSTKEYSAADL